MATLRKDITLLHLPDLVQAHLFKFFDVRSLLNLRLTCKSLKATVEQPSALENVPVRVSCSKQLQRVLLTKVPYNHFVLQFKSLEEQTHLTSFGDAFGSCIRKLVISTARGYEQTLRLLGLCTNLVELELKSMDFEFLSNPTNANIWNKILSNLKKLKRLVIHDNRFSNPPKGGPTEIEVFIKLLRNCNSLEEFSIPRFENYNEKLMMRHLPVREENANVDDGLEDWDQEDPAHAQDPIPEWKYLETGFDILMHPFIEYIQSRNSNAKSRIKRINVSGVSLFEWNVLKTLVHLCYVRKIRLLGIHSTQFMHIKTEIANMDPIYYNVFEDAVAVQLHGGFPLFGMKNLRKLYIETSPLKDYSNIPQDKLHCLLPRLDNLRVRFMCAISKSDHQPLITRLFKDVKRPTVKMLHVEWHLQESGLTFQAMDLVNNFRNLKGLQIHGWDAADTEFILLWTNLSYLESLTLIDCKNLTNRAFVGDYNLKDDRNIPMRPLNRLKNLRRLYIRDLTGNVTEVALVGSVKWIQLQYFHFMSSSIDMISIDVYKSMENSPFGNSVSYFRGPRPGPMTDINGKHVFKKRPFRML